jgi:hypothetical protein
MQHNNKTNSDKLMDSSFFGAVLIGFDLLFTLPVILPTSRKEDTEAPEERNDEDEASGREAEASDINSLSCGLDDDSCPCCCCIFIL